MPDTQYKEVLVSVIACSALFVILATIIFIFLFKYTQRRRIQEMQMLELRQAFHEQSLRSQIEIQEHTFQAISQEIHDNVGQVLSLAKVQANILRERKDHQPDLVEALKDNIGKALQDLRDLAHSLNHDRLRYYEVHEAIAHEADRINRTGILQVAFSNDGDTREMPSPKKLILFRVIQECLQNCLKHAAATNVDITCNYGQDGITINIQDNGIGFDNKQLPASKGQGLTTIQKRVELAGGKYNIDSVINQGTHITLIVPYD